MSALELWWGERKLKNVQLNPIFLFTENIQNVNLSMRPSSVIEGTDNFTLQYSMLQGVVEQQTWRFNGGEVKNSSRRLLVRTSLVILKPNRSDAGLYTLSLTNPFNNVTAQINVPVFCKRSSFLFLVVIMSIWIISCHVFVTFFSLYTFWFVVDGPDEPIVEVHPALPFFEAGGSVTLSCQAQGFPPPAVEWTFGGQTLPHSQQGGLTLTNLQTSQGGVYKCSLLNEVSAEKREKNVTLNVYGTSLTRSPVICSCFVICLRFNKQC